MVATDMVLLVLCGVFASASVSSYSCCTVVTRAALSGRGDEGMCVAQRTGICCDQSCNVRSVAVAQFLGRVNSGNTCLCPAVWCAQLLSCEALMLVCNELRSHAWLWHWHIVSRLVNMVGALGLSGS